jgi:flagellar hook-associated protein 3 FlgL
VTAPPGGLDYRFSTDGGDTFQTGNIPLGASSFTAAGVQLDFNGPQTITANDPADTNDSTGTWMWVYPTAEYTGDDDDFVFVDKIGGNALNASADGVFSNNVLVRVDGYDSGAGQVLYAYSTDGGANWDTGNTAPASNAAATATLPVPGGVLNLSTTPPPGVGAVLSSNVGDQFSIRPTTAAINIEINEGQKVQVNNVGKDIFGGVYQEPNASNAGFVFRDGDPNRNLFDVIGRLVAGLETNNQSMVQDVLADIEDAHVQVMNETASVAGRENRMEVADRVLGSLKLNTSERLSSLEDVDVGELMTKLTQQQITYEAVLKSSSMIMRMSLVNYV